MTAEVDERPDPVLTSSVSHLLIERVVAGAAFFGGLGLVVAGARYGLDGPTGVGPGTFPAAAGALLALSSVLQVRRLLPRRDASAAVGDPDSVADEGATLPDRGGVIRVATVLASTIGAALVLDRIGFVITVGVYLAVVLKFVGHRSWLRSVLVALLVALVVGQVFSRGLGVSLPTTSIGFLEDLGI